MSDRQERGVLSSFEKIQQDWGRLTTAQKMMIMEYHHNNDRKIFRHIKTLEKCKRLIEGSKCEGGVRWKHNMCLHYDIVISILKKLIRSEYRHIFRSYQYAITEQGHFVLRKIPS